MRGPGPLLVAAVAALYFAAFVHYGILLEDEGLLLLQIARTFHGDRPYVDFHTGYPPGGFYLNALLFRLFGESVVPLRALLVVMNAASTGMIYALARRVAGSSLAVAVALGWAMHLPVFVGLFAAFNVPYPSWAGITAFLATQVAFDRHLATGARRWLFVAGLAAGVAFSIKQNSGALAVLACGLTLAWLRAGSGDRDRHLARLLLVLAAVFLLAGFTVAVTTVEAAFILGPALVLIVGRLVWARGDTTPSIALLPGVALVGAGMALVSLVWLVPFLATLGVSGLLREIFLVGTDFDLVYATPYPVPFGFPDAWPVIATLGLAVLALGGIAVERGWVRRATAELAVVAVAAGCAALLVRLARMPEGVARSITLQVRHVSFFAAPLLGLVVSIVWLRRVRLPSPCGVDARRFAVLVFALCMYAQLYPRIDETHLLIALPSGLVLAAWATARVAAAWGRALGVRPAGLVHAAAAGGLALALVAAVPNVRALVEVRDGRLALRDVVPIASARAPVHLDAAHGSDTRALNALLAWLDARLAPGEGLFHFPCVALVPYLLGRPSITRHDYWFAGRPDHLEEAEVVRRLAADPPRFVLTVNRNIGFFSNSSRFYFILRAFVREHYVLQARFGRYDVLARRDVATSPPLVQAFEPALDEAIVAGLAEPLHESRRAAVRAFLERASSADGVAAVAAEIAPDERTLLLLLRSFAEVPDPRVVPFVAGLVDRAPSSRVRAQAGVALNYVALYVAEHRYLLGTFPGERHPDLTDLLGLLDLATARRWLDDDENRFLVGAFAASLVAGAGDTDAIPILRKIHFSTKREPYVQLLASYGLVKAGRLEHLCTMVDFLGEQRHEYLEAIPSLLLELARDHPNVLALCLERGLADWRPRAREESAWIAGVAGLKGVGPALRDALDDKARRVRTAAVWALGRLGDQTARPALVLLAAVDEDATTRRFAAEALQRLDGPPR